MAQKLVQIEERANNSQALGFAIETLIGWWLRRQASLTGGEVVDEEFEGADERAPGLPSFRDIFGTPRVNEELRDSYVETGTLDSACLDDLLDYGYRVSSQYSDISMNLPRHYTQREKTSDKELLISLYDLFLKVGAFSSTKIEKLVIRPKYDQTLPAAYAGDFIVNTTLLEVKNGIKRAVTDAKKQVAIEVEEAFREGKHKVTEACIYWVRFGLFDRWQIPAATVKEVALLTEERKKLNRRWRNVERTIELLIIGKALDE